MTSCRLFKQELERLYTEKNKVCSRLVRQDPELKNWVETESKIDSESLPEQIFSIINQSESQYCQSGNKRKFRNINDGWLKCNDRACVDCKNRSAIKSKATCLSKYGAENPMQVDQFKKQMVKSAHSNDSYASAVVKRKQYYSENFGVDHNWKTADGQLKRKKTLQENYGVDNPSHSDVVQHRKLNTFLKKYGVDHPMQTDEIKDKVKSTLKERYGVDNISRLPATRKKASATMQEKYGVQHACQHLLFQEKAKQTMLVKYGVDHSAKLISTKERTATTRKNNFYDHLDTRVNREASPLFSKVQYQGVAQSYPWQCKSCNGEFADTLDNGHIPRCPVCNPYVKSKGEEEIADFVSSLGVTIVRNSRSVISPQELDIYIPGHNLAIEYNGVYWHSQLSGGKGKWYHYQKYAACKDAGIRLIQILDDEWISNPAIVKSRIRQMLGLSKRIYARKCTIIEISAKCAKEFYQTNHIQGGCNSPINYGLWFNGEIVSAMSFAKSRYTKIAEYELLRFCNALGSTVIGAASRILKHFEISRATPSIVSYCDLRWNSGNVYNSIGFALHSQSSPNYRYRSTAGLLESRVKYQKHKLSTILVDYCADLSEWENMQNNGYDRIWDCGNLVFVKNLEGAIDSTRQLCKNA